MSKNREIIIAGVPDNLFMPFLTSEPEKSGSLFNAGSSWKEI